MRRSGLTRAQLRYAEERRHLGAVARGSDGRRLYNPEQVYWLELLGHLRELGLALDEAAGIASAACGRSGDWSRERAQDALVRALVEIRRRAVIARELSGLLLDEPSVPSSGSPDLSRR